MLNRLVAFAVAVAVLALVWMEFGMLAALGIAFSVAGYLFVLAMRKAAAEIMAYERDQRPDLHVYDH